MEAQRLPGVLAAADQIQCAGFELIFDRLGWWRQNQVAWAGCSETPRQLLDLVKSLQLGLVQEGFKFDERRFLPHITLLRKAQCHDTIVDNQPISWEAKDFVLVSSTLHPDGPHYTIVKRWPLVI